MEVSLFIPKATLSTFSLHSSLVSSQRSALQISPLFITPSIFPSPGSFQSGISIAHYHPLKYSPLNLILLRITFLHLFTAKSSKSTIDFTVSSFSSLILSLIHSKWPLHWNSSYLSHQQSLTKANGQFGQFLLTSHLISTNIWNSWPASRTI